MATKAKKRPDHVAVDHVQPQSIAPVASPPRPEPTEEEIRFLAYHKWIMAGSPPGDGVEFWLQAEYDLRQ